MEEVFWIIMVFVAWELWEILERINDKDEKKD
jgi:hypothetical protein